MFLFHVHNDVNFNATYLDKTLLPVQCGVETQPGQQAEEAAGCRAKRITVIMKLAARGRSWLGHEPGSNINTTTFSQ